GVARIKGVAGSREVATIAAPAGPTKVAPVADAGQTAKEDATVLDRGQETPVRNVGSTQEAPVEPVVEPPRQPATTETFRRVKTVVIREDNAVNPTIAPPAVERAAAPLAPPAAPTTTPQNAAPPATTAQQTAQKAPPPPPKKKVASLPAEPAAQEAAAPSEPAAEAPASGSASVQFGAAPNETEARALAKKVVQKYGSRLGGHKPTWKIAEVSGNTVYRVRVGGLSKEAASSLCKSVKSNGGDCYVAGN
ncbi:MAG: SPOR domain-containing protein, partial [Methylocystis sp.]